ncbi:Acetolactate synthase isozyme 3 large subunit [Hartmannibacter diazotrophicus]|uniref:Acetolactate synthase isozyme 3 large subunit n=1 Tax=Hartmannibacter diazotrophicus TaxID=1482074 RepID=A0A2C9CZX3_9HYPH|nr:thiamine pyrophosphate-requiring protein [Hartmannibacter diazotrophicus]SON53560.1 Acetolactate synthase isozyme 3 large subunit [Hartmannibacter diazotrophicus]
MIGQEKAGSLSAGAALFTRLKAHGVDYVFANSGTDFPPIIEGLAEAKAKDIALPQALVIPHEHAAMGMAHGYYLMAGRGQAVMLHTNVGLANGAIGAINAACEHVPMLLMSGRTPVTEEGRFGARTVPIAWGQEMRDQTALVRESCKWDYELKFPEQVPGLIDRAHAIAHSTPKGPVYLSLPREVLCEATPRESVEARIAMAPAISAPDAAALRTAAEWLAAAERPLVIAQRGAGDAESFAAFAKWAEDWALPVCSWWATHLAISTEHPCHVGADPGPFLEEADVVLVVNALAPWWPDKHPISPDARVIQLGPDPLFSRSPVRNFPADCSLVGETAAALTALIDAMSELPRDAAAIAVRRDEIARRSAATRETLRAKALSGTARGLTKAHVSAVLGEVLAGRKSSVFSELGTILGVLRREDHLSWFQEPHSGGLGWSFPCALGARLADPTRLCVATMGDGSYMFANPVVCHQIAEALYLPILVLILNNGEWGAVRASVASLYPDGYAAKANEMPLTSLKPSPDFTLTAQASRAWTARVTAATDLRGTLEDAIRVVTEDRRQALVDISVIPDGP